MSKDRRGGSQLTVDTYSAGWLKKGFPWVYPKEVERGTPRPGQQVTVQDAQAQLLGRGIAARGFLAARVYRHDAGPLDQAWMDGILDRASAHWSTTAQPRSESRMKLII